MRRFVEGFFYVAVGAFTLFMLWKIVNQDTTTLVTLSESDAVQQSGDRSLEMAKWTIATVLTVGGLLLGANWLQASREREELRDARTKVEALSERIEGRFLSLERNSFHATKNIYVSSVIAKLELKPHYERQDVDTAFRAFTSSYQDPNDPVARLASVQVALMVFQSRLSYGVADPDFIQVMKAMCAGLKIDFPNLKERSDADFIMVEYNATIAELQFEISRAWEKWHELQESRKRADSPGRTASTPDPADGEAQSKSEPSPTQSPPDPPESPLSSARSSDSANTPAPAPSAQAQDEPES